MTNEERRTTGSTVAVDCLSAEDRERMFWLMRTHYLGVNREIFERDLAAKEFTILLRDGAGAIVGFSTLSRFCLQVDDREVVAVFSGDTIVLEQHRGSFETAREISRFFRESLKQFPGEELYWILISKGWRTYRVLRLLFTEFDPRRGGAGRVGLKQIADAFGEAKYPGQYCRERRLVVFSGETQRIRPASPEAIPAGRDDPDMTFFAAANPRHEDGDELVCVAPIRESNFAPLVRRLTRELE